MDKRIKHFAFKPIKAPFSTEADASKAFRQVFAEGLGARVLDQLIIDMEYFRPDLPASHEQMAFNAGKKYVINHILHGIGAVYEKREDILNYGVEEDE